MEIESLLEEAFYSDDEKSATSAIEQARTRASEQGKVDAFSLEIVVPESPDELWLGERILRPLIYFCESTGVPPPSCTGVFFSFFHGGRVRCVLAAEVVAWAARQLELDVETLADRYGTGEHEHAAPRVPA